MNFKTTYADGAFFERRELTKTENPEHGISSPVISLPGPILTTLPVRLSVTESDECVDLPFNLVARLNTMRSADNWLGLGSINFEEDIQVQQRYGEYT